MMSNDLSKVAILLATYNGEYYLREQLSSLFEQTFKKWTLFVHDDGSKDKSLEIVSEFASKYNNVELLNFQTGCGAKESFLTMLKIVEADYYFFCDQDDVWDPEKIETSLTQLKQLEDQHKKTMPIVVHSDMTVVDRNLNVIKKSFWEVMMIKPEYLNNFNRIGANCLVTGCTMCFNRAAKKATLFPAKNAVMHDIWITLCVAKSEGVIYAINKPLMKYRQHDSNTIGAKDKRKEAKFSYKLLHLRKIANENYSTYKMLRDLGYGSFAKYLYYKSKYRLYLLLK